MAWVFLIIAIIIEVGATSLLKASHGFTKPLYGAASLAAYAVSLTVLSFSLKTIPVGVAYAIWSGVGTACIVVMGVVVFKEPITALKVACIAMIVVGAIGLNLVAKG